MSETQTRRSALLSTIALLFLVAPAVLGLSLLALFLTGWVALTIPLFAAATVYLYRLAVLSSTSYEGRVVAREVGAAVLALAAGFGTWIALIVLGIATEVLPSSRRSRPIRTPTSGRSAASWSRSSWCP